MMKKITYLLILLLAFNFGYGQTKIAELTFENPGGYSTNITEYIDIIGSNNHDYFTRTDGSSFTFETYSNIQGNYYFAAQDIDNGGTISFPVTLLIDDINISGYSSLEFRVHLAEDDDGVNEDWDNLDYIHFNYDIDNTGGFTNLLWFEGTGGPNTEPTIDTNFDGIGDVAGAVITDTFNQFTQNIAGTGNLIDIQIDFRLNGGQEDIAIDNIEIWGVVAACGAPVTWNGTTWTPSVPDISTPAIIDGAYTTNAADGSFSACSLIINATTGSLNVTDGYYVEVENDVTNNGTLIVENHGAFVQNDDSASFGGTGTSVVRKSTSVLNNWYDYTYWSSPVSGLTIATSPLVDSDRVFSFDAGNYLDVLQEIANTNTYIAGSDDIDDNGDDWQYVNAATPLTPGVGFAATHAQAGYIGALSYGYDFTGNFNNGVYTAPIVYNALNTGGHWNFIGNPYPCALDFDAFVAANSGIVDGAAYLWSHSTPLSGTTSGDQAFNFSQNDYVIITAGSGSVNNSPGTVDDFIPSGQGFFIASLATGNVTFNNSMRLADGTSNSQFFRNSNSKSKSKGSLEDKLWINLTSDNGVFNQILVAYVNGATDEYDGMSFDAPRNLSSGVASIIYTLIEGQVDKKYAIQGKQITSLNTEEVIPLGFYSSITSPTLYKFSIDRLQGDFLSSNTVYLKDNLLNKLHNLSASNYTFTSEVGEFNERFEVVFNANALSTEDISKEPVTLKIIELENDHVQFTTSSKTIKTITIFDLLGRELYNFKGQSNTETYKLSNLSSTIYIAKVELTDGTTISKKAIKK